MSQLRALTGLRFFAAFIVVVFHFAQLPATGEHGMAGLLLQVEYNLASAGLSGVNLFFILSGFILSYNYLNVNDAMRVANRDFWVARIARVYPVYLLGLVVAFVPDLVWTHCTGQFSGCKWNRPIVVIPSALALVQTWVPFIAIRWNPPSWSLSAEAFFYLVFPVLAPYVLRISRNIRVRAMLLLWLASMGVYAAFWLVAPGAQVGNPHPLWLLYFRFGPFSHLSDFLIGVVLCGLYFDRLRAHAFESIEIRRRYDRLAAAALLATIVVMVLAINVVPPDLFAYGFMDPLFALGIFTLAVGEGTTVRFLASSPLLLLGEASYAIYILQYPLYDWLARGATTLHWRAFDPVSQIGSFFVPYFLLVLASSILSFKLIEQPARRAIRASFSGQTRQMPKTLALDRQA